MKLVTLLLLTLGPQTLSVDLGLSLKLPPVRAPRLIKTESANARKSKAPRSAPLNSELLTQIEDQFRRCSKSSAQKEDIQSLSALYRMSIEWTRDGQWTRLQSIPRLDEGTEACLQQFLRSRLVPTATGPHVKFQRAHLQFFREDSLRFR